MQETNQKRDYNMYNLYLEEYEINMIVKYNSETEKPNEKSGGLESILEEIKTKFEEKAEEQEKEKKTDLEEKLKKDDKYVLPRIYKNEKSRRFYEYIDYLSEKTTAHHINQKSKAHVFYVDSSALPKNVLGMYVPSMHSIYISNSLTPEEEKFVYYHEEYHSLHGAGEAQADNYAASIVGYDLRAAA